MKLEELIRQQAEEYLKTATRLATESALTGGHLAAGHLPGKIRGL